MAAETDGSIDAFIDALWLLDGLSRNTLAAYRRDLSHFEQWLQGRAKRLVQADEADLNAYFAARHAQSKATTANRRLTVFRRYFRWALRERFVRADPTLRLLAARQPLRVPHSLSEAQVQQVIDGQHRPGREGLAELLALQGALHEELKALTR